MIARALKPQTFTITMESTAAAAAVIVARAEFIISLYPKGFRIFVLGFRIFGYDRFRIFRIQKVFVSFEGSHPKDFCIFSKYLPLEVSDVIASLQTKKKVYRRQVAPLLNTKRHTLTD